MSTQPPSWSPGPEAGWAPPGGSQPPGGFGPVPSDNGKATAALVTGIVGILCVPLLASIAAIVLGMQAKNEIDRSNGAQGGRGKAMAGIILGWLGVAWALLWVVLIALVGVFADDIEKELEELEQYDYESGFIGPAALHLVAGVVRGVAGLGA